MRGNCKSNKSTGTNLIRVRNLRLYPAVARLNLPLGILRGRSLLTVSAEWETEELLLELLLSRLFVSGRSRCVSRLLTIESFTVGTLFSNVGAKVNRRSLVRVELKRGGAERPQGVITASKQLSISVASDVFDWPGELPLVVPAACRTPDFFFAIKVASNAGFLKRLHNVAQ